MAQELFARMAAAHWKGVNKTMQLWKNDYSNRSIISEFLKDKLIGLKRLASMPDRMTNTINTATEGKIVYRPTVINCYDGKFKDMNTWWKEWQKFMFTSKISVNKGNAVSTVNVHKLLAPISKAKYPSITKEEAEISVPLQTLCLAIFDAILIHMMSQVGPKVWQPIRSNLCNDLNYKKNDRILEILENRYGDMDIIFLQEVAANFNRIAAKRSLSNLYDVHQPEALDPDRDQNSFILLKKDRYEHVSTHQLLPKRSLMLLSFVGEGSDW
jgi:hypothetical protein